MKKVKILNFQGEVICMAMVDFHRWVLENGWFKVYNYSDNLVFKHYMNNNEYSWRAE